MINFDRTFYNPELAFMELHRYFAQMEDTCKGLEVLCMFPFQLRQFRKRHFSLCYLHYFREFDITSSFKFRISLSPAHEDGWNSIQISILSNSYRFSSCVPTLFA